MKLDLLPHEGPLLAAGATALCRSVEKCCDSPRLACDGRTLACNGCYGELLSPFPPVGSECEAEYRPYVDEPPIRFRFRVAALDVRRARDLKDDSDDMRIFEDAKFCRAYTNRCNAFFAGDGPPPVTAWEFWWTATFPDAPFDKSFCWIATLTREAAKED